MLPASRAALAALAVSLAACSAKPPADDVASATCLPVIGVYPSWAQEALPLAKVRWDKLSHLGLVFALPRPDGSLDTSALDALIGPAVSNAHAQGVKVAVAIGGARGYGDAFQRIAESDERLTRFTREVSAWVQQHGIDGVDIDWEHWTRQAKLQQPGNDPVESRQLVRLLAAMRAALPREVQLSASIFAGPWAGPQYLPEIQQHVDFVNLMAFDFTGRWDSSPVGHHADFDTFQLALKDAVARGFARDKIVAGIPFYGKRFANGLNREVQDVPYRTLLPSLQAGAHGYSGVMTNFHPELYVWLCDNWQQEPEKAETVFAYLSTASLAECLDYPICAKDYQKSIGNFQTVACRVREAGNYYSAHFQSNVQQMVRLGEIIKKQVGILQ